MMNHTLWNSHYESRPVRFSSASILSSSNKLSSLTRPPTTAFTLSVIPLLRWYSAANSAPNPATNRTQTELGSVRFSLVKRQWFSYRWDRSIRLTTTRRISIGIGLA